MGEPIRLTRTGDFVPLTPLSDGDFVSLTPTRDAKHTSYIPRDIEIEKVGNMSAKIYMVKTENRQEGIRRLLGKFDMNMFKKKRIALKANYNSADEFPASTHPDTLKEIVLTLKEAGAGEITLAERSGMGITGQVLKEMGVTKIAAELDYKILLLDGLSGPGWVPCVGEHWTRGYLIAKLFQEDMVVQTCCLKTHKYGGHFTISLKNSVGMIARYDPKDEYDYMEELHSSKYQRLMIAEVNQAYTPSLILMDALEAFIRGGPDTGRKAYPGALLAGNDRVAMDAVGVAILRLYDTTPEVARGKIFEQEQIRRACELGLGVSSAGEIDLVPLDPEAEAFADRVWDILRLG